MYCDLWWQYIQVRKLFKGGNYSRKYGICAWMKKYKFIARLFCPIGIHTPTTKLNTLIIQTSFFWSWGGRRVTPKYSLSNKISKIQRIANQWHPTEQIGQTKYSQTVWHIHDGPQVVDQCSFCGTCLIGSKAFWSRISISLFLTCQLAFECQPIRKQYFEIWINSCLLTWQKKVTS